MWTAERRAEGVQEAPNKVRVGIWRVKISPHERFFSALPATTTRHLHHSGPTPRTKYTMSFSCKTTHLLFRAQFFIHLRSEPHDALV